MIQTPASVIALPWLEIYFRSNPETIASENRDRAIRTAHQRFCRALGAELALDDFERALQLSGAIQTKDGVVVICNPVTLA